MVDRPRLTDLLSEVAAVVTYPALGYALRRRGWREADLDVDLTGKVMVVTGASRGLGHAIARGLACRGATVVMVSRDPTRAEAARRAVEAEARGAEIALEIADLSSVEAVHALAERVAARWTRVHGLINNAGLSLFERRDSVDGHELTFATNVLGGFVLTSLLTPLLARAAPARVIHMTSAAIYTQRLDTSALLTARPYHGALQYARTKRAQVELNTIWVPILAAHGITSTCVHPGLARTPGVEEGFPIYNRLAGPLLRDADQGADTALWLAASPSAAGRTGELWFDRAPRPAHVVPWTESPRAEAERLFAACAAMGRVTNVGAPMIAPLPARAEGSP
jgi:NAD(P)-dependent dehydrogenase (short-subunit alcohol dehydrogenase family)